MSVIYSSAINSLVVINTVLSGCWLFRQ
ncbi:hypothetical protein A6V17_25080, partial [Escherichia coli]